MPSGKGPAQTSQDKASSQAIQERTRPVTPLSVPGPASAAPAASVGELHESMGNQGVGSLLEGIIQRCTPGGGMCAECSEEQAMLQRSPSGSGGAAPGSSLPGPVVSALSSTGGRGLESSTRSFMEARFGQDFGHVRVHTDQTAARAADAIGALAFTVGPSIWFGRGQYQPGEGAGLHLLAHELTHTIQQRGRPQQSQASLRVGAVHDPAEFAADRAADAVLSNTSVARIGASGAAIRRKPKVSPVANNPSHRIVTMDDGKRYRVTRNIKLEQRTEEIPAAGNPKFSFKINKDNVWMQVDWCKGTSKGDVKIGADLPAAAQEALKKAGAAIWKGQDPIEPLKGVEFTPFASVSILESKKFRIEGVGKVSVEPFGGKATGGSLGATLKLPDFEVSAEFKITEQPPGQSRPGMQGGITVTIPLEKPEAAKCPTKKRTIVWPNISYQCEEIVPAHEEEKRRTVTRQQSHYLYFRYAEDRFEERASQPGGKLNPKSQAELQKALADGYKVNSIKGFASPEGPREPSKRFIGNIALSEKRAEAARKWIESKCPPPSLLSMRPDEGCFAADLKSNGKGELYGGPTEGPELKGKPLAETAVAGFEESPAEERHRTPEVAEEIKKRERSPERQTDVVYPLLRRAEIELSKQEQETYKVQVPEEEKRLESCPRDVLTAAEQDFERTPVKP